MGCWDLRAGCYAGIDAVCKQVSVDIGIDAGITSAMTGVAIALECEQGGVGHNFVKSECAAVWSGGVVGYTDDDYR